MRKRMVLPYVRPESTFDFRNPDYRPIFQARVQRLAKIRENPDAMLPGLLRITVRTRGTSFQIGG